jgi:hypothetical protein
MRSSSPSLLQPLPSTNLEEIDQEFVSSIEQEESISSMFGDHDNLTRQVERCFRHNSEDQFSQGINRRFLISTNKIQFYLDRSSNRKSIRRRFRSNNHSSVEEKPSRLHRIRSSSTTTISINNEIKSSHRRKSTSSTNSIKSNNNETVNLDKVVCFSLKRFNLNRNIFYYPIEINFLRN